MTPPTSIKSAAALAGKSVAALALLAALMPAGVAAGVAAGSAAATAGAAATSAGVVAPARPVDEGKQYLRGSASTPANWPKALALFGGAAKSGDPAAAYYLGLMYRNGMGVARDSRAAARWLEFAAKRQVPAAMFVLANMLLSGEGVARDELAARRWIEKAADLEYAEAVMAMALGLRDGSMGFERNEALAEVQMREAAHALRHRRPEP
ncbi:tetratricopeptide repeat protein [Rugamonas sp. CCM 8940]|uniref:tetratricopeptide repeat protein n=1 Tax=Rugamonas sp. CCM 8940 TaxID=2765359 RepID=UPI0018F43901|nr:tetratricopeptide repeat protein [Rugamonas sp. CCM 8940]MBJ7313772.1 sel1 repeat family protein [Rugamonas sp. CCM 8940]